MVSSTLHDRLNAATRGLSYRQVADKTDTNHETARRYLNGQPPSTEFLAALCARLSISGQWLLTGRGPMRAAAATVASRRHADAAQLLTSVTSSLGQLSQRVQRLEAFLKALKARRPVKRSPRARGVKPKVVSRAGRSA